MKQFFILISASLLIACNGGDDETTTTPEGENPIENEGFSQYLYEGCNSYVSFDESDNTFLLWLRSKGYDLNNDGKISCSEASQIQELNFDEDITSANLKGIEAFENLKRIEGSIKTPEMNLYNNLKLESINMIISDNGTNIRTLILPNSDYLNNINISNGSVYEILNLKNQTHLKYLIWPDYGLNSEHSDYELDLSGCTALKYIRIKYLKLKTIKFPESINSQMDSIDIGINSNYVNRLLSIDLSTFPNLKSLNLDGGNLEQLNLQSNPNLKKLSVNKNKLTNINLSGNGALETISLNENSLPNINFSNNTNLKKLSATHNLISDIDLSHNLNLKELDLSYNWFETINLSHNANLELIVLSNNQLPNIDLSHNPKKKSINLNHNKLDGTLDLKINSEELYYVSAKENSLLDNVDLRNNVCSHVYYLYTEFINCIYINSDCTGYPHVYNWGTMGTSLCF